MMEQEIEKTVSIKTCPTCGLELAGENAICACDSSFLKQQAKDPMIGKTLSGYYKVLEVIGRGGMGVVYKARDPLMDRIIAIKMLHQHLIADAQSVQRFQQEARAASAIQHPNVITAYDFGMAKDTGQPYLVMEYLQGRSLSDVIEAEGAVDYERAVKIFIQVCDALATAHAKNVLHRDLKPSNIMLIETKDDKDVVKIVDFGIAKMMRGSGKEMQQLTQTGEVFGSPLYMAPEQFLGSKLDVRTDVYAMGCVMYEALIGKPPIMGEHVLETMFKHLHDPPQHFNVVRPELKIPEKVEAIIFRALEKDQDQRFQTMAELRDALMLTQKGFKDRRPLKVRVQAKLSQFKRLRKKYEDPAAIALIAILIVFIGVAGTSCFSILTKTRDEAEWRKLKQEAQEFYRREDYEKAEQKLLAAAKVAKNSFGGEDPRYSDTMRRLAWVYESEGNRDNEIEDNRPEGEAAAENSGKPYVKAKQIYVKINKLSAEDQSKVRLALMAVAARSINEKLIESKAVAFELTIIKSAINVFDKYYGPTDPALLPLLDFRIAIYEQTEQYADAENDAMRVISIMNETEGPDSLGSAKAYGTIAHVYELWHMDEAANKNYAKAMEIYKSLETDPAKIEAFSKTIHQPKNQVKSPSPEEEQIPQF